MLHREGSSSAEVISSSSFIFCQACIYFVKKKRPWIVATLIIFNSECEYVLNNIENEIFVVIKYLQCLVNL